MSALDQISPETLMQRIHQLRGFYKGNTYQTVYPATYWNLFYNYCGGNSLMKDIFGDWLKNHIPRVKYISV